MSAARHIIVQADPAAVAEAAARRLIARVAATPVAAVCLTGGSSPQALYRLLATPRWRSEIPWSRVHWFLGDERAVPPGDPLSNGAMAREAFLDRCAPPGNVHMIATAGSPDAAARAYESELEDFGHHRRGLPLFDLVLLGVGPDGHVASLFPGAPGLEEHDRLVIGVDHANVAPFVPRITLTLSCLASTREMLFLAAGRAKRDILRRVFADADLPANRARADGGDTVWLLDEAADPRAAA
jgi:6-phosphogluconolactonase